jgi:hypothetical protein
MAFDNTGSEFPAAQSSPNFFELNHSYIHGRMLAGILLGHFSHKRCQEFKPLLTGVGSVTLQKSKNKRCQYR